jgi:predicted metal-dependent hydrolase
MSMPPAAERSEIHWGTTTIPYLVRRSARRATVSIAVEPGGAVVLTAPTAAPIARLDQLVRAKARWIAERVRQKTESRPAPSREYVSGEACSYLGRHHRLRVLLARDPGPARLERGWLVVPVPRALPETERRDVIRSALSAWYEERARRRLPPLVAAWAQRFALRCGEILVRDQAMRWGSCDAKGNLRFNWRVMQAPMRLVEYVVAHEVAHLAHRDHTADFWALLGRAMPDYEERRAQLKGLGAAWVW